MAVRIRLTRVGATKRPAYRVIAIDKRRSRDGRALEILGYYDPLTEPATVQLDRTRIQEWIGKGAQPSDTVVKLMRQAEQPAVEGEKPKPATRAAAKKPSKKAQAKAAAAAEPDATAETAGEAAGADAAAAEAEPTESPEVEAAPAESTDEPAAEAEGTSDENDANDEKAEA